MEGHGFSMVCLDGSFFNLVHALVMVFTVITALGILNRSNNFFLVFHFGMNCRQIESHFLRSIFRRISA